MNAPKTGIVFMTPISRKYLLILSVVFYLGTLSVLLFVADLFQNRLMYTMLDRESKLVESFYYRFLDHEAGEIATFLETVKGNSEIASAFAAKDRGKILKYSAPLFESMNEGQGITHFYFSGADRKNILRVHNPPRYGDVINRITTLQAEKSGEESFGLELGPFGTLTLRVVSPWKEEGRLIGYVELGKEIEHAVQEIRDLLGISAYMFVHKKFIERGGWEEGMEVLGRKSAWDRFVRSVNIGESIGGIPEKMIEVMSLESVPDYLMGVNYRFRGGHYRIRSIPIIDAGHREVGHLSLLVDVSDFISKFRNNLVVAGVLYSIIWLIITVFIVFYFVSSRSDFDH